MNPTQTRSPIPCLHAVTSLTSNTRMCDDNEHEHNNYLSGNTTFVPALARNYFHVKFPQLIFAKGTSVLPCFGKQQTKRYVNFSLFSFFFVFLVFSLKLPFLPSVSSMSSHFLQHLSVLCSFIPSQLSRTNVPLFSAFTNDGYILYSLSQTPL